ncbi:hypothetical protein XELAEV_18021148mg [Xenopus laevis]|uniref:Uncharacterized protein n=1 Tax=Xenopus laevis TaxID=8355 RepID=A0A974HR39_XENLA|nr:hypothetical protein XELAEV_18021148mg [Xenopus laevis]
MLLCCIGNEVIMAFLPAVAFNFKPTQQNNTVTCKKGMLQFYKSIFISDLVLHMSYPCTFLMKLRSFLSCHFSEHCNRAFLMEASEEFVGGFVP